MGFAMQDFGPALDGRHNSTSSLECNIMPMLTELQKQFRSAAEAIVETDLDGETLIRDTRHGLHATQILEDKFGAALTRAQGQIHSRPATQRGRMGLAASPRKPK